MITNKDARIEYDVFRNNLKYYRKQLHWSQEDLAEQSDLSTSYIKQIESGNEFKNISLTTLLKLSKALGVSINTLFQKEKK